MQWKEENKVNIGFPLQLSGKCFFFQVKQPQEKVDFAKPNSIVTSHDGAL